MYCYIEAEVRNEKGKVTYRRRYRSRSFVANFLRFLRRLWMTEGVLSATTNPFVGYSGTEPIDITNVARGVSVGIASGGSSNIIDRPWMKVDAPVGIITSGIIVGYGTTAPTPSDYKIENIIAHGVGAGQLSYGADTIDTLVIDGLYIRFKVIRPFTNGSGAIVTVKEIALYTLFCYLPVTPWVQTCCLARDVLASPIDVPNGGTLTIRYVLQVMV